MLWSLSASIHDATEWHWHEIFECILCRAGSGQLELEGRLIELRPGRTIFIAPGVRHRYAFDAGTSADLRFLCMNEQDVATHLVPAQVAFLAGVKSAGISYADHGDDTSRLWELASFVPDGFIVTDTRELGVVWGAIGLLLALHVKASEITGDYAGRRYHRKIREIREWLDVRLHEAITLDHVGEHFGLSRSLLTREFRRHTGKSFIDYCNARRVEKAAKILSASGASITTVAFESGFSNLSHFHRQFKAMYGMPPAAFRRQIVGRRDHPASADDVSHPAQQLTPA